MEEKEYQGKKLHINSYKYCCQKKKDGENDCEKSMKELNNEGMGIAAMLAVWKHDGVVYSISEYCQGGELFDLVNEEGISPDQAVIIYLKLLITLHCLHQNGLIHLDLKLDNILIAGENDPKNIRLIDFGFSCQTEKTEAYKAKTKARKKAVDLIKLHETKARKDRINNEKIGFVKRKIRRMLSKNQVNTNVEDYEDFELVEKLDEIITSADDKKKNISKQSKKSCRSIRQFVLQPPHVERLVIILQKL